MKYKKTAGEKQREISKICYKQAQPFKDKLNGIARQFECSLELAFRRGMQYQQELEEST